MTQQPAQQAKSSRSLKINFYYADLYNRKYSEKSDQRIIYYVYNRNIIGEKNKNNFKAFMFL
jgi:hypothetical protein